MLWFSHVVPYPPKAGVLLRAYHLLTAVARHHEVDLVAFVQEPLLRMYYDDVEQGLSECREVLEEHCGEVLFLPILSAKGIMGRHRAALLSLLSGHSYVQRWLNSRMARIALDQFLADRRYELVHFDSISLAAFRGYFPDSIKTLNHHNAESKMLERRAEKASNMLARRYFAVEAARLARFEGSTADDFALHVTCSELDSERLQESMPGAPMLAIPNGVDVSYFTPAGTPERRSTLIFVGTLNWYPNIDAVDYLLREIWPRLKSRVTDATLDLVGAGASRSLQELAADTPDVTLHGYVPEVRPMIDSASLYVCPIRDGGGTKLKILDAMAMGKCIVAHPIACEGIDVKDGHSIVYAESPNEYCDRIEALLAAPEERGRIGQAARTVALERYAFDKIGERLAGAYGELVAAAPETRR